MPLHDNGRRALRPSSEGASEIRSSSRRRDGFPRGLPYGPRGAREPSAVGGEGYGETGVGKPHIHICGRPAGKLVVESEPLSHLSLHDLVRFLSSEHWSLCRMLAAK